LSIASSRSSWERAVAMDISLGDPVSIVLVVKV
jgi:hypothetical protein